MEVLSPTTTTTAATQAVTPTTATNTGTKTTTTTTTTTTTSRLSKSTPGSILAPIRPIEESSKRRIVAGQAVFDLASAVKELVDNALDANSKSINIRLFNQGIDIVEVSDDGCGVPVDSRPFLATAHATSKIRKFEDIYRDYSDNDGEDNTLGFRGEALFCLANLSDSLIVATRTAHEPVAQKMEFQRDGSLKPGSVSVMPRKIGTTVAVVRLLEAVPVRRADLIRRIHEQRRKVVRIVQGYAVFSPGVALQLFDIHNNNSKKNHRQISLLATPNHCANLAQTIVHVFGSQFFESLTEFQIDLTDLISRSSSHRGDHDDAGTKNESNFSDVNEPREQGTTGQNEQMKFPPKNTWNVRGFISKFPSDGEHQGEKKAKQRLGSDQQLYSVNKRPVDLPRVSRMFNEVWRSLSGPSRHSHPSCILEFTLPRSSYDVNVSPDKREVIMPRESELLEVMQQHVTQMWTSQTEGQFVAAPSLLGKRKYAHSFDDEDNNGGKDTSVDNNKFNRRYAFSHDVAKIRLQHQFDDGRIRRRSHEDDDGRTSMSSSSLQEPHDQEQNDSEQDDSPQAEEKVDDSNDADNRSEPKEPQEIPESPEADSNDLPRTTLDSFRAARSGEAEDRLWRSAKRRFHESSMADSRREELATLDRAMTAEDRYSRRRKQPSTVSHSLETFGFGTTARNQKSLSSVRTVSGGAASPPSLVEGQSKRVSFDSAPCDESALCGTPSISTPPEDISGSGSTEALSDSSRDLQVEKECSDADFSASEAQPRRAIPSHQSPVWSAFNGTDDVIKTARRERLAMLDRRVSFHSTEAVRNDATPEELDDDVPVANRVNISLQKGDFKTMEVIGQFNMGFILAKSADNHLWIMDQHACDEKYNFERLVKETKIHEQPLIAPMPLELSHSEETCILDNIEIFETNGFRFAYDAAKPARRRFSLVAIPHSGAQDGRKAVQFGKEDVAALCAILSGDDDEAASATAGTGTDGNGLYGNNAVRRYAGRSDNTADGVMARLPKAVAMFASRACRGSIMIGKSLSIKEMDRLVKRLADIQQPWNCPHGRSTMTHAADLRQLILEDERNEAKHLSGPTVTVMTQELEANPNST